jgi:predicted metal-dependent phosphoesterase TrpH
LTEENLATSTNDSYAAAPQAAQVTNPPLMGKADLHMHTTASDGMGTVEEVLDWVEHQTDLAVIAISDHDEIRGAWAARELMAKRKYRFELLMAQEITTRHGHLLVYGVEEPFRMFQSLEQTVNWAHEKGGFVIVPHPLSFMTLSVGESTLRDLYSKSLLVEGIETLNPSIAGYVRRERVQQVNTDEFHIAEVGNSDAHFPRWIGTAYTLFEGNTTADLLKALREGKTQAGGRYLSVKEQLQGAGRQNWRSLVVQPADKIRRVGLTIKNRKLK